MDSAVDMLARLRIEAEDKYPFHVRASVDRVRGAYVLKWRVSQSGGWNNDFEYLYRVDLPLETFDGLVRLAVQTGQSVVDNVNAIWQVSNYRWDDLNEGVNPTLPFDETAWPGPPQEEQPKKIRLTVIPEPIPILRFYSSPVL